MRIFFLFLLILSVCLPTAFCEAPRPRPLVLTSQVNGTEPEDTFSCAGTIHGYLVLPKRYVGRHQLEGIWTKPDGSVADHSQNEVNFDPPGRSTAYLWFAFPERSSLPGAIDPAGDAVRLSFNGLWRLAVLWDNQPLTQSTFTVNCL